MREVFVTSTKLFQLSTLVTLFEFSCKLLVTRLNVPASEQTPSQWILGGT